MEPSHSVDEFGLIAPTVAFSCCPLTETPSKRGYITPTGRVFAPVSIPVSSSLCISVFYGGRSSGFVDHEFFSSVFVE